MRRNIGADNAGNANGLSHFCADPGGAPPSKSSAIITTLAQRVETSLVALKGGTSRVTSVENPFDVKVLPMCPDRTQGELVAGARFASFRQVIKLK
jgi:hypothetical protein